MSKCLFMPQLVCSCGFLNCKNLCTQTDFDPRDGENGTDFYPSMEDSIIVQSPMIIHTQ